MLKIINDLKPFFEDCYRRISVREYAKIMRISPPTASKTLARHKAEGLLLRSRYRNYLFFHADSENKKFIDLSKIYWSERLNEFASGAEKKLTKPVIILFGSLSKAEAKEDSDVDLAIFAHKKELNTTIFEKKMGRKLQIHWFESIRGIKNTELANNILNGYVLRGRLGL